MGKKKTGGHGTVRKTYSGSRSGARAKPTTGGSASSAGNNPSGGKQGSKK